MLRRIPPARVLVPRLLILGGLALCGSALRADSIFSNFVTGPPGYSNEGTVPVTDGSDDFSVSEEFTPADNFDLSGILFVVGTDDDPAEVPNHTITLGIFADNGGVPGATALETLTYTGPVAQPDPDNPPPILSVTSLTNPELLANNHYWLVMDGPAANSLFWYQNLAGDSGIVETDGTPGNWHSNETTDGVFEIDGTLVSGGSSPAAPEPAAWLLMIAGIGTMAFLRQARR
jgi:hypothetical protein